MAYDIGPKIGIDGEAEFRRQLSLINTGVKTLGTEMAAVTSAFIGQENSQKSLTAQNDVLTRTVSQLNEKLELQKKMLAESTKAYGEADERTLKWQQAVNTTQAELNKATAKIDENKAALKDNGKAVEDTADKHESSMARIGAAASKAMQAVSAALAGAGTAVAGLVKTSLSGYAEQEQLIGGVDTLFGDSAEAVVKNANRAFSAAGLSANEYMETVTSFSASLIASLNGDTYEAMEFANIAIVDMADNANKMGTSIESIQNAYQGFAKQNYTMLDNLKLGYGGTKEEMQRLLDDAKKITGYDYDITKFVDIVDAIHEIQDAMGIAGATADEAATTIEGSTNAMKAAWTNLITGMGSDNADLNQLINLFVDSSITMLDNVVPRVQTILSGMGTAIQDLAPVISDALPGMIDAVLPGLLEAGASLLSGLADGVIESLPVLVPVSANIVGQLAKSALNGLPQLADTAVKIVGTLADDLSNELPSLVPSATQMVTKIIETIISLAPDLLASALKLMGAFAQGVVNSLPVLASEAPKLIKTLCQTIADNLPQILSMAGTVVATLATGLIESLPDLGYAAGEILGVVIDGIKSGLFGIWSIGGQIVDGLWDGIREKASWLSEKVTGMFSGIVNGVKDMLGIHSPSTVFSGIGANMAAGMGKGWDDQIGSVRQDITRSLRFDAGSINANLSMPGLSIGNQPTDLAGMMEGMVNGMQTAMAGSSLPQSATIILQASDGMTLARWMLPDLRAAMRDDPEIS